jgi:hypothetical protein
VFATVRYGTSQTKDALLQETAKLIVFKLIMAASQTWRRLQGEKQLPKVIRRVIVRDGIEVTEATANSAACSPHHPHSGLPPYGRRDGMHDECASGSGASTAGRTRDVSADVL